LEILSLYQADFSDIIVYTTILLTIPGCKKIENANHSPALLIPIPVHITPPVIDIRDLAFHHQPQETARKVVNHLLAAAGK
jgi:hypothetical protein